MLENSETIYNILRKAQDLQLSPYNTGPLQQYERVIDSKHEKNFKYLMFQIPSHESRDMRHWPINTLGFLQGLSNLQRYDCSLQI